MALDPTINIPNQKSQSDLWMEWHKELKGAFGRKEANQLWMKAWSRRGSSEANTRPLREYLKGQGIELSESAWDKIVDLGGDVTDFFGDFFKMGKWLGIILFVAILLIIVSALISILKNPARTAAAVATRGASEYGR